MNRYKRCLRRGWESLEQRWLLAIGDLLASHADPSREPQAALEFGAAIALDGDLLVVGAKSSDYLAANSGTVFVHDARTGELLRSIENPNPGRDDWFGDSVDVSGQKIVVGAPRDDDGSYNAGSAYRHFQ